MWQTTTTHTTLSWRGMKSMGSMQTYAWLSTQVTTHVKEVSSMTRVTNTEITLWAIRAEESIDISVRPREVDNEVIVEVCGIQMWLTFKQAKELSDKLDSAVTTLDENRLANLRQAHEEYERLAQN